MRADIVQLAPPIGIELRAGLHTGEVELKGDDIAGIAAKIAGAGRSDGRTE